MSIFCFTVKDMDYYVAGSTVEEAIKTLQTTGIEVSIDQYYNKAVVIAMNSSMGEWQRFPSSWRGRTAAKL